MNFNTIDSQIAPTYDNDIDKLRRALAISFVAASVFSLSPTAAKAADDKTGQTFSGNASWYGIPFNGKKTASGEIFDMNKLSAAHKTLPLPTKVLVENPKTGKSTIVKVNDRGPYVKTRVMDLSRKGALDLGYLSHGTAFIDCTVLPKTGGSEAHSSVNDESENKDKDKSKEEHKRVD